MAIRYQKVLIVCGIPAIIAIVSLYWQRKRKKAIIDRQSDSVEHNNTAPIDSDTAEHNNTAPIDSTGICLVKQIETFGDSLGNQIIIIDNEMQLRENNSTSDGDNKAAHNNSECNQKSQSDGTASATNKLENNTQNSNITPNDMIDITIASQLKRQLKLQCNASNESNNNNNRNVSEDFETVDCNRSGNADNEKKEEVPEKGHQTDNTTNGDGDKKVLHNEINRGIVINGGFNGDNYTGETIAKEDISKESCSNIAIVANGDSHPLNDNSVSIIRTNDDGVESAHSNAVLSSSKDYDKTEAHTSAISSIPSIVEDNSLLCNGVLMSHKNVTNNSGASSLSRCSPSASQFTNGYETDAYHNYPDSVSTSADHRGESPPHSAFSDNHSEGSSDSGKGGSDILHRNCVDTGIRTIVDEEDHVIIYQFEIPQCLCGILIGSRGVNVKGIRDATNTKVVINLHHIHDHMRICTLEGTKSGIRHALDMIRNRLPHKEVSLRQINLINSPHTCPATAFPLQLPSGILCDVILSSMVNAGHFFVQQPTHPTYPSLSRLDQFMSSNYSQIETPLLPHVHPGMICAVQIMGGWYRGVIVKSFGPDECEVMFVDYGGYSRLPISSLRQIRADFMTLPFQASECYLANVTPVNPEEGWTNEANVAFEELAQGQILQSNIVAHADDGIPMVHLYKVQGVSNVFINQELVNRGFAHWIDIDA